MIEPRKIASENGDFILTKGNPTCAADSVVIASEGK
jgi:hypothetical protein